ncbi:phosphoenolpyruvate-utilizing N-terminal domain-containing protein, partial [Streptococcus pneumoniae]|nr:phosphoenolpyruvate-utilizing N-terminal domain-containing protein [Streptococcus pneumoniae]
TVDKKNVADPQAEIERFGSAVDESIAELEVIKKRTAEQISEKEADIFGAHLLVLQDPELIGPITDKIKTDNVNAEFALHETSTMFVDMFEAMDNEYMKERAADVRDVTKRVLAHLLGVKIQNP